MTGAITSFLEASVRTATPLALAALGELLVERGGVINIGLEGIVLGGAFGALIGAGSNSLTIGFAGGCTAGVAVAALFALFAVTMRADQIITGTAVNLLVLGLTGALYRGLYGATGAALTIPTTGSVAIPLLARIPVLGPTLFDQPPPTYLVYLTAPLLWWWLYRTHSGLAVRAIGERPEAVRVAGVDAQRRRWMTLLVSGGLGGLAGATLVLSQSGTFAEGMSAGRGFIAIAIVVLGRWRPMGVLIASLLFGAASALQYLFQAMGWRVPYQLFLALPYVLTLLALAGFAGRKIEAPAALGRAA
ncbi:MAG TPA: ABC transporter permease [Gemmatimonadaceae bacterium]|nr:ABC transporter permease [Gemmatimonadaceae bacterium]